MARDRICGFCFREDGKSIGDQHEAGLGKQLTRGKTNLLAKVV